MSPDKTFKSVLWQHYSGKNCESFFSFNDFFLVVISVWDSGFKTCTASYKVCWTENLKMQNLQIASERRSENVWYAL